MKVIVADDDPAVRLLLVRAVQGQGHSCLGAETASAALDLVDRMPVDVVVSDWRMPELDGLQLCRLIRERDAVEYVYFVLVTADDDREHALAGIAGGVDDFLTKPVDLFELRLRLMVAERIAALHRRLAARQRGLELTNREVAVAARHDPLTGLGNRLKLGEDLAVATGRKDRYGDEFSVALFDLDHFKTLNDAAGHLAGDEALRDVATVLRRQLRNADLAYRYGGEEFLVLFSALDLGQAFLAADRIRRAIEAAAIRHPGRPGGGASVTLSAGVAAGQADADSSLIAADAALYRAKSEGRNRVAAQAGVRAQTRAGASR